MYADNLIGPGTIDTLPEPALEAFIDHGEVRRTLDAGLFEPRGRLDELARLGIDLDRVTDELEEEGVRAFARPYDELLGSRVRCGPQGAGSGRLNLTDGWVTLELLLAFLQPAHASNRQCASPTKPPTIVP
jgi:hypothetical protein